MTVQNRPDMINRAIRDTRLSWGARGLFLTLIEVDEDLSQAGQPMAAALAHGPAGTSAAGVAPLLLELGRHGYLGVLAAVNAARQDMR